MSSKSVLCLVFAASCLLTMPLAPAKAADELITNGPQVDRGDRSSNWSAARNIRESERYERLLRTNPRFRQARMRKECGPITDAQLRQSCLASFHQDEPSKGSSNSHRSRRS